MAYKITIEKIDKVLYERQPPATIYQKIHDRIPEDDWQKIKEYDYVDNPNKEMIVDVKEETKKVFEQIVDELNLSAVVAVINNLNA